MKPKRTYKPGPQDECQTPPYAVGPLLEYVNPNHVVWEPAAGKGYLVKEMRRHGLTVRASTLSAGQDFFDYQPPLRWDILITNPPFSLKYDWLDRCVDLSKPFALLLPLETLGSKHWQKLYQFYPFQVMLLSSRVNFETPSRGWYGSAQFPVGWFCYKFNLPQQLIVGDIDVQKAAFEAIFRRAGRRADSPRLPRSPKTAGRRKDIRPSYKRLRGRTK